MEQYLADRTADRRARLSGDAHGSATPSESFRQGGDHGSFTGPLRALEGEERAFHRRRDGMRKHSRRGKLSFPWNSHRLGFRTGFGGRRAATRDPGTVRL